MIGIAALLVISAVSAVEPVIEVGAWTVECVDRRKDDCRVYEAVRSGPVTLKLRRTADAIRMVTEPVGCDARPAFSPINPSYSATTLTHMMRGHIVFALNGCDKDHSLPELVSEDIAEVLRLTQDVSG